MQCAVLRARKGWRTPGRYPARSEPVRDRGGTEIAAGPAVKLIATTSNYAGLGPFNACRANGRRGPFARSAAVREKRFFNDVRDAVLSTRSRARQSTFAAAAASRRAIQGVRRGNRKRSVTGVRCGRASFIRTNPPKYTRFSLTSFGRGFN